MDNTVLRFLLHQLHLTYYYLCFLCRYRIQKNNNKKEDKIQTTSTFLFVFLVVVGRCDASRRSRLVARCCRCMKHHMKHPICLIARDRDSFDSFIHFHLHRSKTLIINQSIDIITRALTSNTTTVSKAACTH
jgi:hypothetical protein